MGERIAGGRLKESLARLAELRDAMGLDGASYRSVLGRFVAHVDAGWPEAGSLTREMVDGYLALHPGWSANTQRTFVSKLRVFARFLVSEGGDDFVPDEDYEVGSERYQPYLFTDDELAALFAAIDAHVGVKHGRKLEPELVLPVWSRMLYCCGMRPGEPPTLLREDVDLDTGDVYVRQSKRHRDRHLVMSDGMRALCSNYDSRCPRDRRWFFERFDGAPYTTRWFGDSWLRIVRSCGIEWRGEPPRPYDLRHAFASRNVVRWMDEGLDVMCMVPTLSAYMGHSSISSTLYYVHLIPERLRATKGVDWASLAEVYGEGDAR